MILTLNAHIVLSTCNNLAITSSYIQVPRTNIISRTSSNFNTMRPRTAELAALFVWCCQHPSAFNLIGSSSFLQVIRIGIRVHHGQRSKAALERLKTLCIMLSTL